MQRRERTRIPAWRRRAALALAAVIAIAWAIPGPVPALIARQEAVLLGRWAVGHFAALALGTVVLGVVAVLLASRRSLAEGALLAAMAAASTFAGVVAISTVARQIVTPRYESSPVAGHVADPALRGRLAGRVMTRQPDYHWDVVREDLPAPGRSYPNRVPGRPARPVVLTTDDRGLRNPPREGTYDVVVTGDSFTEGSMVSDDETWWRRVASATGLRIYSTAVSGLTIREYLNNWVAFGLDAGARTVVVMIYEGNDWKPLSPAKPVARAAPPVVVMRAGLLDFAWNSSPLRWRAEQALIQLLAPIGADWPLPPNVGLDWMPVAWTAGGATNHYAFEPKHMMRLDWDPAAFRAAPEWTTNEAVLRTMAAIARERGIRLVFAYAPVKPHVLLPLVRDRVSAESLRAFAAFRDRGGPLPADPVVFRDQLYERLGVQEATLREWCAEQGVEFVSLTAALEAAVARGVPAYFTYDPHWTEEGHAVAAEVMAAALSGAPPPAPAAR